MNFRGCECVVCACWGLISSFQDKFWGGWHFWGWPIRLSITLTQSPIKPVQECTRKRHRKKRKLENRFTIIFIGDYLLRVSITIKSLRRVFKDQKDWLRISGEEHAFNQRPGLDVKKRIATNKALKESIRLQQPNLFSSSKSTIDFDKSFWRRQSNDGDTRGGGKKLKTFWGFSAEQKASSLGLCQTESESDLTKAFNNVFGIAYPISLSLTPGQCFLFLFGCLSEIMRFLRFLSSLGQLYAMHYYVFCRPFVAFIVCCFRTFWGQHMQIRRIAALYQVARGETFDWAMQAFTVNWLLSVCSAARPFTGRRDPIDFEIYCIAYFCASF